MSSILLSLSLGIAIWISTLLSQAVASEELPAWVHSPDESAHIVASSEEVVAKIQLIESRMSVVRDALARWANENCGSNCTEVVNALPDELLDALIDGKHIEPIPRVYDSDSNDLSGPYEAYRGHWRVCIGDELKKKIQSELFAHHLRRRLAWTLVTSVLSFGFGAILWSYLLVARLTRGFYISRLRWIAGAMLMALIGFCYGLCTIIF